MSGGRRSGKKEKGMASKSYIQKPDATAAHTIGMSEIRGGREILHTHSRKDRRENIEKRIAKTYRDR